MKKTLLKLDALILLFLMTLLITLAPPAQAQVTAGPRVQLATPLGDTNLTTLKTYTNLTVTFNLKRGRGFGFHTGIFSTNLQAGSNITSYLFHFATPHTNAAANALVTNWEIASPLTFTVGLSSNLTFWGTNIGPLLVDNATLGRLFTISNAATADTKVNLTNTFITTDP